MCLNTLKGDCAISGKFVLNSVISTKILNSNNNFLKNKQLYTLRKTKYWTRWKSY